jgi:chromosome segregation ATPase
LAKKRLVKRIHELTDTSAQLRASLLQYERTMTRIAERLEAGEDAIAAAKGTSIPNQRRRVTEAIEEFESARHQLRLALMVAGKAEGASIAEVGRVLGISRQLAARLAAEADDAVDG